MNERFSDLLKAYLDERDRRNSGYYENRSMHERIARIELMAEMLEKMDLLIHGAKDD